MDLPTATCGSTKVDSDPSVAAQLGGWQWIEYPTRATLDSQSPQTMPREIARFGDGANTLTVLRVAVG